MRGHGLPQRHPGWWINTASIGAYPMFVQTRMKLEHKIGKPLAGIYAMFHTLRHGEPVRIRYDNKELQTSLFFLGNSVYLPSGFAPSRRTRIDDGLMDVRILETGRRFSRMRILVVALGRWPAARCTTRCVCPSSSSRGSTARRCWRTTAR